MALLLKKMPPYELFHHLDSFQLLKSFLDPVHVKIRSHYASLINKRPSKYVSWTALSIVFS